MSAQAPARQAGAERGTLRSATLLRAGLRRASHLGLLALLVLAWWYVSERVLDRGSRALLPPPQAVVAAAWELTRSGELWTHLRDSLERELVAFLWACSAIPLGMAMGWWRWIEDQFDPVIEVLRPVPPLAWIPLSILWFGIGDVQNEFIIFLACFFPILVNTVAGVKGVEPSLVRAARCLGANVFQVLWRIVLRAALPQIVMGVRVGLGVGWMALVAAELVGANSGLGFLINDSRTILRTDYVIVGMAAIGVVGFSIDRAIRVVVRRLMPWSQALGR